MKRNAGNASQIEELLYQALETEIGGLSIYETALACAVNEDLKKGVAGLSRRNPHASPRAADRVRAVGAGSRTPAARPGGGAPYRRGAGQGHEDGDQRGRRQRGAAGRDRMRGAGRNQGSRELDADRRGRDQHGGTEGKVLKQAYDAVVTDEEHHLYHTKGWSRELWIDALGYPAVLPPPEEVKQVESAIGASRAEQARGKMLSH